MKWVKLVKRVKTSSYKMSKSWEGDVQHGDKERKKVKEREGGRRKGRKEERKKEK